jgi:radical SAM protein with 4Fe4S-binding SPASM domain
MPETLSQPQTTRKLGDSEIARMLKHVGRTRRALRSLAGPEGSDCLPGELGLQVTSKCNLRCSHCFQWGEDGHFKLYGQTQQRSELDVEIIDQLLVDTRPADSALFIWGGEPLAYRYFDRLLSLIQRERRWSVICTNGIGLERHLKALLAASASLVLLVSLDGLPEQNDAIRGAGTFSKAVAGIRLVSELKRKGLFEGEISVASVISDGLVGHITEFAEFVETLGVNTLHLNFPWYISPDSAHRMDELYASEFRWLKELGFYSQSGPASWHSYSFRLSEARMPDLHGEIRELHSRPWKLRIKLQPLLPDDAIESFLRRSESPPPGHHRCVSIASRLSVLPNGKVTTCKQFPEFTVGDLNTDSLTAIWNGPVSRRVRETLSRQLTPICSRCVQLYLHPSNSMLSESSSGR